MNKRFTVEESNLISILESSKGINKNDRVSTSMSSYSVLFIVSFWFF